MSAACHRRVAVLPRKASQDAAQLTNVRFGDVQRSTQLQDIGRVHDVLSGRTPVDVAAGLAAHRHKLVD